ncbi:MAG: MinD/ParA family protein [Clostridia bacterium]|nr:MinD/ParA family protein [Clostridia bacterium]
MDDQAARLRELVARRSFPLRTLAVGSGKGGVGKTSVALNLGLALSERGRRVAVLDGDLGLANVDVMLGLSPHYTLYDVLAGQRTLEEIVLKGPANLHVIPGGSGIAALANLSAAQRQRLVESLRLAVQEMEFLIIDTGAGIGQAVMSFLLAADEVIVVLTPEPTALADAYALIKVLAQGKMHRWVYLLVNRVSGPSEARQTLRRLQVVVQRFLGIELRFLGFIPEDAAVSSAVLQQRPLLLSYPRSRAAEQLRFIAQRLLGEEALTPAAGRGGFLARLLHLLG